MTKERFQAFGNGGSEQAYVEYLEQGWLPCTFGVLHLGRKHIAR